MSDTYTSQNGPRDTGAVIAARYILTDKAIAYLEQLDHQREEEDSRGR